MGYYFDIKITISREPVRADTLTTPAIAEAVVQQIRRRRSLSRIDLARELEIAPSTVGIHVDRLVGEGYLTEGRRVRAGSGRPPTAIELNAEAGQFIGVDLDAREIYAVSVDFAQVVSRQHVQPLRASAKASDVVGRIADVVEQVRDPAKSLLGIGLALPGTVDAERGIGLHYEFIRGWRNVDVASELRNRFDTQVLAENNIRAMALAEQWFGQGSPFQSFVCIGIRSGIGCGIVVDGELFRGANGFAGEIGGWPIDSSSRERRTLEQVASLRAIQETLKQSILAGRRTSLKLSRRILQVPELLAAVTSGDHLACTAVRQAAETLGTVIAQMSIALNPEGILICGPLAVLEGNFLSTIRSMVEASLPKDHSRLPTILGSQLGESTGALGAAALAAHAWKVAD